jgi:hypothetical protein
MVCYEYLNEGNWLDMGNYYTPDVLVTLLKPDGSGQVNAICESDSGAAITLLPRGYATLLGLVLTDGKPITLGGVGGSVFTCYIHRVDILLGDSLYPQIPIAFAPTDDFPPLLGRLGIYDAVSVIMENTFHATCFGEVSDPLPSPSLSTIDLSTLPILAVVGLLAMVMLVTK